MGYELKSIAHESIGFLFDMFLLGVLIVIIRPSALFLIYAELLIKILILSLLTFVHFVIEIHPNIVKEWIIHPYQSFMKFFLKDNSVKDNLKMRGVAIKELWECILCIGSLSLLLRLMSGPSSTQVLKKHKNLSRHSCIYRFTRHIL